MLATLTARARGTKQQQLEDSLLQLLTLFDESYDVVSSIDPVPDLGETVFYMF